MILLSRLEKIAADNEYFSELQFGFREGVGCIEASFTILETINHMLEQGSKGLDIIYWRYGAGNIEYGTTTFL